MKRNAIIDYELLGNANNDIEQCKEPFPKKKIA